MMNLRELAVIDLRVLNNRDWGLPIEMISPDGITYDTDAITGEQLKAAQILYDYRKINPDTGEEITVHEPIVSIAKGSLARVPIPGEKWYIRMPIEPSESAAYEKRVLTPIRQPEGGSSLGFIRLYPGKVIQN